MFYFMFKRFIILGLFAFSLAVIIPSNSVLAKVELTPDTVITKDNVHQVFEYLDVDTSDYNENEIEKEVKSSPEVTVGEIEKVVREMRRMPEKITTEASDKPSVTLSNNNEDALPFSTGTVTVTRPIDYDTFTITYRQTGIFYSEIRWDAWRDALGSSASISSPPVGGY